jgi:hypothetical protein
VRFNGGKNELFGYLIKVFGGEIHGGLDDMIN